MDPLLAGILITLVAGALVATFVAAAKHWWGSILKEIKKELVPNGGSSARDAIDRIERATEQNVSDVAAVRAALEDHITTMALLDARNQRKRWFR